MGEDITLLLCLIVMIIGLSLAYVTDNDPLEETTI